MSKRAPQKRRQAAAKRRSRRKRRSFKIGPFPWKPVLAVFLAVGFITWWIRYDPAGWFRLGNIRVSGPTEHLTVGEIEELAAPTFGLPLMSLDLDPIRDRIQDHLWVRTVGLRRLLPNTLYIHVQEHVPAARVALPEPYVVSTEGIIFKKLDEKDPKALPVITGFKKTTTESDLLHRRLLESLAVINRLDATGALEPFGLSEVRWEQERTLSLITDKGSFKIELGEGPWKEKLDRLIHVLPHVENQERTPTRIALDSNDGVVVRYANIKEEKL